MLAFAINMKHYSLEPEVSGGWGKRTEADTTVHPPIVYKLHYQFDGWLGDSLIESFPCYLVTSDLADLIISSGFTGAEIRDTEITISEEFIALHEDQVLPNFKWLHVIGIAGQHDFGICSNLTLIVSDRALMLLKKKQLDHCDIEEWSGEQPH
jgi:hypothetical protein